MIRNILAILAGFAAWSVLWLASNAAVTAALPGSFTEEGGTDNAGILALFLVLSVVASVVAGYLCALLARRKPRQYALILGVLLLTVGLIVQFQFWDVLPVWYHLFFLGLLVPGVLVGARAHTGKVVAVG